MTGLHRQKKMLFEADADGVLQRRRSPGCKRKPIIDHRFSAASNSRPVTLTGFEFGRVQQIRWQSVGDEVSLHSSGAQLKIVTLESVGQTPQKHTHLLINIRTGAGSLTHRDEETHTLSVRVNVSMVNTHSVRVREPMEKRCAHRQEVTRQTGSHLPVSSHAVEHAAGNHVQHEVAPRPETQQFTSEAHVVLSCQKY